MFVSKLFNAATAASLQLGNLSTPFAQGNSLPTRSLQLRLCGYERDGQLTLSDVYGDPQARRKKSCNVFVIWMGKDYALTYNVSHYAR